MSEKFLFDYKKWSRMGLFLDRVLNHGDSAEDAARHIEKSLFDCGEKVDDPQAG